MKSGPWVRACAANGTGGQPSVHTFVISSYAYVGFSCIDEDFGGGYYPYMLSQNSNFHPPGESSAPKQEVILLDGGWDPTKYLAVGLRNAGCSVHMVTASGEGDRPDAKFLGRHITCEAVPPVHTEEYIGAIGAILARRPAASVLALTEEILYRVWDAAPLWADRLFPVIQPWQRELLRNKASMSEHVAGAGVRIPMQRRISPKEDTRAALREFELPVVVKGTTGWGGSRVRIANSEQDALDAITKLAADGDCFLQEYVAGQEFSVGGLFLAGQPIRIHAWKRFKEADVTGPSLRNQSNDAPALIDAGMRAFRALKWTGLGFLQGVHRSDGKDFFIEFNPRPWGSIAGSARVGVDLFTPLAQMLAGGTPTPDLSFIVGKRTTLFPQAANASLRKGGVRALASLVRDPHLWLDAPWSEPGLVAHLSRQLWWRWRDGTKGHDLAPALDDVSQSDREAVEFFERIPIDAHKS